MIRGLKPSIYIILVPLLAACGTGRRAGVAETPESRAPEISVEGAPAQGPPPAAGGGSGPAAFAATGNEPGWKLEITDKQITLLMDYGKTRVAAPAGTPDIASGATRYAVNIDGRPLTATILNRLCADTMTGTPYPNTVVVSWDGQTLRGCGGNPASLLQGAEWVVVDIGGAGVADGMRATMNFAADGALSGRSFCNSYRGAYILTGEGLSITLTASTLMGCAPAVMSQETLFTGLLADVRRSEIGADRALTLHTAGRGAITARRP
jgi:heat shock protein HslJ